jgi:hypothetical protein
VTDATPPGDEPEVDEPPTEDDPPPPPRHRVRRGDDYPWREG